MPYSYVMFPEQQFFMVTCSGVINDFDLYDFRATMLAETRLNHVTKRLYDARQVTSATFSSFNLWRILLVAQPTPRIQRAFVVPRTGGISVTYRFALRFFTAWRESKIFFEMDDALDWLQLSHDEVFASEKSRLVGDIP